MPSLNIVLHVLDYNPLVASAKMLLHVDIHCVYSFIVCAVSYFGVYVSGMSTLLCICGSLVRYAPTLIHLS